MNWPLSTEIASTNGRTGAGGDPSRPIARHLRRLPKVVYVVRREGPGAVFASQVVRPMSRVAESGYDVTVAVLSPLGQFLRRPLRKRWTNIYAGLPASLHGRVRRLPAPPSRLPWDWAERRMLRWWLQRQGAHRGPLIVQGRNATATNLALDLKQKLGQLFVIYDCRGIEDEEHLYLHQRDGHAADRRRADEADRLGELQRRAARASESIVCVSRAMVDYLADRHAISREKCHIVPCCVEVNRFGRAADARRQSRRDLGLENRFVVCYCGSLQPWQRPEESLALFRRIQRREPRAHFLAVTTQPASMQTLIEKTGIPPDCTTVVSVPADEVPRYLAAADCGVLLREASPVNRVASPVKYGEYLASGTPVLLNDGIGDYSALTRWERVGVVLPSIASEAEVEVQLETFLADYRTDPAGWRSRCRRVAKEHLDWDVHAPKMLRMYEQLAWRGSPRSIAR